MNTGYGNSSSKGNSMTHSRMVDPFERLKEYDRDLRQRYESENDPERPPKRDPGDRSILISAIVGLIVGGVLGVVVGGLCFGFIGGWLGLLGGFIAGGVIGVIIGDSIGKRRLRNKNLGVTQEKRPDLGGPFKKV